MLCSSDIMEGGTDWMAFELSGISRIGCDVREMQSGHLPEKGMMTLKNGSSLEDD